MRKAIPAVVRYHGSATSKFVVEGLRVGGKRTRKFFPTRRAAELWLRKTLPRIAREGEGAVHMPERLRIEAVACADKLKLRGKTITEATDHFLAHLAAVERSCTVTELVAEFIEAKTQDGASTRYLKDLKNRLERFEESHGKRIVAEIQARGIDDWLRKLQVKPQTRNNFRTVLSTLFEFAVVRDYALYNPIKKTAKVKVVRGAPGIFAPQQMRKLLETAPRDFIPHLVIGAFAGLRTAEIERLDWSEIDLTEKLIHVKAEKSKSAQRRIVAVSDHLAAWLAPHARKAGPVSDPERAIVARRKTCSDAKIKWPSNALRHSFASYHLMQHKNAAMTAAELGHTSPAMLYKHYRELVKPEQAAQWWQIAPSVADTQVVAFSA